MLSHIPSRSAKVRKLDSSPISLLIEQSLLCHIGSRWQSEKSSSYLFRLSPVNLHLTSAPLSLAQTITVKSGFEHSSGIILRNKDNIKVSMEQANAIVFESQTCFYSPYIDRQVALLSKEKDIQVSLRYACSGFGIFDRYLGVS